MSKLGYDRDYPVDRNILDGRSAVEQEGQIADWLGAAAAGDVRSYTAGVRDLILELHPRVFPPLPVSLALARAVPDLAGQTAADLGTGTGLLAGFAATRGAARVVASDLNPEAVRLGRRNMQRNGLQNIVEVEEADWLPASSGGFDFIVSNPPFMQLTPRMRSVLSAEHVLALDGGVGGAVSIVAVIRSAARHLNSSGRLLLAIPEWCDQGMISDALLESGLAAKTHASARLLPWTPLAHQELARGEDGLSWRLHRVEIVLCQSLSSAGATIGARQNLWD